MKIFKIVGDRKNSSTFSLRGIIPIYDNGKTKVNAMQTSMAVLNWIKSDTQSWLYDDGNSILWDNGDYIKLDN